MNDNTQQQANAAQISQAQFELIGRLTFENALLKGEIAQLQVKLQEGMSKVASSKE